MIETFEIKRPRKRWWILGTLFGLSALVSLFVWWQTTPPGDFPVDTAITIPRGLSAGAIANLLEEKGVVRSADLLYVFLVTKHNPNSIQAGLYVFSEPLSVAGVAERLTNSGNVADNLVALTLPEGFTVREFAQLASVVLPNFSAEEFIALATKEEGFFFPDTYYLPIDFKADELMSLLKETYQEKISSIKEEIEAHDLSEYEIITLASLIEREANTEESMKMVSGILQNRLAIDMALQADASMEYVLQGSLQDLKPEDLEKDSPYNTYKNRGLPPTPIGNPGLQAIEAVLRPTKSDFIYYITGDDGIFRYAKTFDEHKANISRYLK